MRLFDRNHPGVISHHRGVVPQVLRGEPRIILDTGFTGGDTDISTDGTHVIEGITWTTASSSGALTSGVAGSDGLVLDWQQNNQTFTMTTDLQASAGVASDRHSVICAFLSFEPIVMGNGCVAGLSLQQASGGFTTEHDLRLALKNTPRWQCTRRTSSGSTIHYFGDNPIGGSLPSEASCMLWSTGFSARVSGYQSLALPENRAHAASDNATGELRTKTAAITAAGTWPIRRYFSVYLWDTQTKVRLKHCRIWLQ